MPTLTAGSATTHDTLTNRQILRFYLPLALSWIFMAIESPVAIRVISELRSPEINTAAFNLLMGLALWIESPVIDLLSTSTTLSKSRQSFFKIQRFVLMIMLWVTALHALIALTPLYDVVTKQILGVQSDVADAGRTAMILMIPWSAMIGWRRYLQGILIRNGRTRIIGFGTAVRVGAMVISAFGLAAVAPWNGVTIAGAALVCSVTAEAVFIHFASRQTVREQFGQERPDEIAELTMRRLAAFHFPLTLTTMVTLIQPPLVSAALARSPDAVTSMAAFQVASSLMWLCRTIVFALPEVVITLHKGNGTDRVLFKFCVYVGLLTSSAMLVLGALGLDRWFFVNVLGVRPSMADVAHIGFLAGALTPFIGALQSYVRGMLTAHHLTVSRLYAVLVSVTVLVSMLTLGVTLRWEGVITAGVALSVALAAELAVLGISWRNGRAKLALNSAAPAS